MARALVTQPTLILADEPTGNLDTRTSVDVMSVFQELNDQGITIVLVTHEHDIAAYAKRIVEMRDGMIRRDAPVAVRRNARADLAAYRRWKTERTTERATEIGPEGIPRCSKLRTSSRWP